MTWKLKKKKKKLHQYKFIEISMKKMCRVSDGYFFIYHKCLANQRVYSLFYNIMY
jgi:hypothetical protein